MKPENDLRINVQDGELKELIQWVASASGRNFIIDPKVEGKVTVISQQSVTADEAYQILLSVLQVHGFAAVNSDGITKIVPDPVARQSSLVLLNQQHSQTPSDELVIQILKPRHIGVNQLQGVLHPLLSPSAYMAAHPESNGLIVADRAGNIAKLQGIVDRIDQASEQTIDVVELKFAGVREAATLVQAVLPQNGSSDNATQSYKLALDERTNSLLVAGAASQRQKVVKIIQSLDRPAESSGNTQVVYLHYLKAQEVAGILQGMVDNIRQGSTDVIINTATVSIQPGETTNALVLTAPQTIMDTMLAVIKKLDIRRAQVLVEAIIVEVKDEVANELGVQWSELENSSGTGLSGGARFSFDSSSSFNGFAEGNLGAGLSLGWFKDGSLKGLIRAMEADDAFNILSTPNLVTLDNEQAKIIVGQNVPFVTGQSTGSSSSTDNPFQTIERKDIGTKLTITPRINGGDAITLKINQEISSINTKTQASDVVTDTRSVETSVLIRDGDVLVLGGLITDEVVYNTSKVPLLGDIPLLGRLFTAEKNSTRKRNLMLFVRPTIMKTFDVANRVSHGRYRFIQDAQRYFDRRFDGQTGITILPDVNELSDELPVSFSSPSLTIEPN
ncbi:type II secretion system secretin GspD [Endozoicomonas acroporae]|uniref:type II secretion system secretin GspD n=1 Tax=Endozoicomonas acroporae TaxID=1701104 RepID=UPI0015E148A1|nr:type II secretion system secretin GspD [Endozoicomonas acroporae]